MLETKPFLYTYKHHIIPRHEWKKRFGNLKGFNASDNVAWLTPEMVKFFAESQQGEKSSMFGKRKSEETKRLMSIASKGKVKTPEHRAAISAARKRQHEK